MNAIRTKLSLAAICALALVQPACAEKGKATTETATTTDSPAANTATTMDNNTKAEQVDSPGYTKLASGLQIKVLHHGNGEHAEAGDKVQVHYTGTLLDGKKFDSSRDRGQPFEFKLGMGQVIRGWDEGIAQLRVGDRAMLIIPSGMGYGSQDMGNIPPNSTLVFDVELMKVTKGMKPVTPVPYETKGVKEITTASGLKIWKVKTNPKGAQVQKGQTVTVHYSGYLENGTMFDSSVQRGETIDFPIGVGRVIKGWDEAIPMLHVGEKARIFIPYNIAYGEQGSGPIPPKSNLIFDVEVFGAK